MSKRFKLTRYKGKLQNLNNPNLVVMVVSGNESEDMKMEKALLKKYPNLMIEKKGRIH